MSVPVSYSEIISSLPAEGLFRQDAGSGLPWLASPKPLELNKKQVREIQSMGHILAKFQDVCDDLYQASTKGKHYPWIAGLLDTGKPRFLLDLQQGKKLRNAKPQVIRPDLMMTANGFSVTELDSVPGGMGITRWLSELYSEKGWEVIGGAHGMTDGFRSILPDGADILVSEESADYRPEMTYFARVTGTNYEVHPAEHYQRKDNKPVYRFFELFDLPNIPGAESLLKSLSETDSMTPPAKPHFEEKLWLALFHYPGLRSIWKSRFRENHLARLDSLFPKGWILDPAPLPPQAALPWLNLNSWEEVSSLSQTQRRLVVKISGFSEQAWGARGVHIGHDLPAGEWASVIRQGLDQYQTSPWMMQEFIPSELIVHPYFDPATGEEREMKGFARICPYYFRPETGNVQLRGCLATIVPSDKKKIHGMSQAILVPCAFPS